MLAALLYVNVHWLHESNSGTGPHDLGSANRGGGASWMACQGAGKQLGAPRGYSATRTAGGIMTITTYGCLRSLFPGFAVRSRAIAENHACVPCIARAYRDRELIYGYG